MLIKALCDYYDMLAADGKVLPEGYSKVKIHYLISLTSEGIMDGIIDCQRTEQVWVGKKAKEKKVPLELTLPQRTEKPGIDPNLAEHRPLYIFGLNQVENGFEAVDRTEKAKKSHQVFVESNLAFTEGMQDPLVLAYRNFLMRWEPEKERQNEYLLSLGKDYGKSGYAFCLSGHSDRLLHDLPEFKKKWEQQYGEDQEDTWIAQCAVTGERQPIARIHNKIKGVAGGLATGSVLIGFKNPSGSSYGNDQSYNSNISESVMKKYTEALNKLLGSEKHKVFLEDLTIVFWAMNTQENCEDLFEQMMFGRAEGDAEQTEAVLKDMMDKSVQGKLSMANMGALAHIDPNVEFYMVGLKPNSSRISMKFIVHRKFADIMWNIARFQKDLQVFPYKKPISLFQIASELVSPKSTSEKVNPALMSRLIESILNGGALPYALLETVVRRVRIDVPETWSLAVRIGIIKACINRESEQEEIHMALDRENTNQAYLCGRLFAVLEKIQRDVSGSLNRTIRDTYFASASSRPALIFPKLIRLSQNHQNKLKNTVYYSRLMGEIMQGLDDGFPDQLMIKDQGRFMVGYYQQMQSFFEKKEQEEN